MNETTLSRAAAPTASAVRADGEPGAVSWAAVFAGAVAAAALSLILLVLGVGLGMSSISPWSQEGVSATTFGVSTILWLTITALLASGLGGYIAGRLRARWTATHVDEVYFRDTAHGFLAWAVSTLITAAVLTSAVGSIVGAGARVGASAAGAAGTAALAAGGGAAAAAAKSSDGASGSGMDYFTDSIFRKDPTAAAAAPADNASATKEVATIFAQSIKNGSLSPEDQRYAAQLVAQRTGLSPEDAQKRVADVYARSQAALTDAQNKAKEAADKARKATSYASLWLFISLLIGAFAASLAATFGGRRRDLP